MTENKKRFRKEHIKGTGMQFIVDETTRKENSTGSVDYKAYSTTDMTCDKLVDLLNELATKCSCLKKENEQLKKRLIKLKEENVELKEENEKLWCDGE